MAAKASELEEQGYRHATTGNRTACPTLIGNGDYQRGFLRGHAQLSRLGTAIADAVNRAA